MSSEQTDDSRKKPNYMLLVAPFLITLIFVIVLVQGDKVLHWYRTTFPSQQVTTTTTGQNLVSTTAGTNYG